MSMLGAINHVALAVPDLENSRAFYRPILEFLGYGLSQRLPGLDVWESASTGTAINFWQARPEFANRGHEDYAPGLHHLAFNADSRERVDDFYELLVSLNVNIVDAPAEYDYAPGYYAVYFRDPYGIRVELVHIPAAVEPG